MVQAIGRGEGGEESMMVWGRWDRSHWRTKTEEAGGEVEEVVSGLGEKMRDG